MIIAFLNSYTIGISGGDILLIQTLKRINRKDIYVVTSQLGKKLCQEYNLKAIYKITSYESEFKYVFNTYLVRTIRAIFLNIKPNKNDLLYVSSDAPPDVIPAFFLKLRNSQTRWLQRIYHIVPQERILSSFIQRFSFFIFKKFADKIIIPTHFLKKKLLKLGFERKKINIIRPTIDLDTMAHVRPAKRQFSAVFMGRLHPSKGIYELPQIWEGILAKLPQAKLAIIGTGQSQYINKLKKIIIQHGLKKNISLLGFLDDKSALAILKASKIFVFPSHEEGFSLAIAQALACQKPVIAYNLNVYEEIFGKTIFTIPKYDINTFSKKIISILKNV